MRSMLRIVVTICALPLAAVDIAAQDRTRTAVEDSEATLSRLLGTGVIRRARRREEQGIREAVRMRGRGATMMPFYVVRKPFAGIDALSGGASVNFLVPWSVTLTNYGQTHSTYYRPSGLCLHGTGCPPCPSDTPASPIGRALDATKAGCVALPSPVPLR